MDNPFEMLQREMQEIKELLYSGGEAFFSAGKGTDEVMKMKGACDFLKINNNKVRKMCKEKSIPFFMVGNEYRFLKSKLIKWAEDRTEKTAGEMQVVFEDRLCG